MKRVISFTVVSVFVFAAGAAAQSSTGQTSMTKPLAEVAKDEEARRKTVRKPAKVYTNHSLRADISAGVAPPPSTDASASGGNASPSNATPAGPAADAPKAEAKDQTYWQNRIKAAREQVTRTQMFADSLQTRINSLWTDFVNRDNPVEKRKIEMDRNAALAELERVKKELADQTKAISAIEDEARRAGVPSGWLRPGA